MKSAHRQASQHKRRMWALDHNPVVQAYRKAGHAASKTQAEEEFADLVLTTRITLLSVQDGDDATEVLSNLALIIGTPCEAGARQYGRTYPWVRHLHGALRTIHAMCLAGYRWQAQYALALDRAIEIATEPQHDIEPDTFAEAWVEATSLAASILTHSVAHDAISA
jgi:hypothetical protein